MQRLTPQPEKDLERLVAEKGGADAVRGNDDALRTLLRAESEHLAKDKDDSAPQTPIIYNGGSYSLDVSTLFHFLK